MKRGTITVLLGICLAALPMAAQDSPALRNLDRGLAQAGNPLNLPDDPSVVAGEPATQKEADGTSEILASDPYHPLTKREKWHHFLHRTVASATFLGVGENTVFTRVTGGFMYCCGIGSWGEQYAAGLADGESRQFFGNFLLPTLLKQDPRYFPRRTGTMWGRAWYAATRVLITRNDSGRNTFNFSEILGVALSKGLSNAYYPERDRGAWDTTVNILGTLQGDATSNLLREFWPEIRKTVHKHTPKRLQSLEERLPLPSASSQY